MPKKMAEQHEVRIISLLKSGNLAEAEAVMSAYGGVFYAFHHGYASLADILDAALEDTYLRSEVFLGAYCVFLVKQGRARRARALLDDEQISFKKTIVFDMAELLISVHLGEDLQDEKVNRWRRLEGHLPVDQPLQDGIYYNCMLVVLVRLNKFAQARNIARQALESLERARKPYLMFFIHLHLADLAIVEGNLKTARRHVSMSERLLLESGVSYGNERELIEVAKLAIDFEVGKFGQIPARATKIRRAMVDGDSWAENFIQNCRIGTMSTYFTQGRSAAIAYLEDCQVDFHRRHGEFSSTLDVILAHVNQLDGRNEEAQQILIKAKEHSLFSAIGTAIYDVVQSKVDPFGKLETVGSGNSNLRREIMSDLVKASAAKSERQPAVLRRHVENAMRLAVKEDLVTIFLDHRDVVTKVSSRLASGKFARGHLQLARMARRIHKLVQSSYVMPSPMQKLGISTQQLRVITALQNGSSNKQIARNLGISEATVKFHLRNLFKRFNARKRGELIEIIDKKYQ